MQKAGVTFVLAWSACLGHDVGLQAWSKPLRNSPSEENRRQRSIESKSTPLRALATLFQAFNPAIAHSPFAAGGSCISLASLSIASLRSTHCLCTAAKADPIRTGQYPFSEGQLKDCVVGNKIQLQDFRESGDWWRFRALRETLQRWYDPRTEAGFAYVATHEVGEVLFCERSFHGNGMVRVNKHGQWRCLMFSEVEQGLAYFENDEHPSPEVLGYQYTRVMTAAALAFMGLQRNHNGDLLCPQRVLCVGLGTGAIPGFLAHHLPSRLLVDVVEIDPVVLRACREQLHCRFHVDGESSSDCEAPYNVFLGDASDYVRQLARKSKGSSGALTAIFLDAYDDEGCVPKHLLGRKFLRNCRDCLAPGGVVVCNCFNGKEGGTPRGEIDKLATTLAECIGPIFTVPVSDQPENLVLVSRRGTELPRPGRTELCEAALMMAGGQDLGIGVDKLVKDMLWAGKRPGEQSIVELVPPQRALRANEDFAAQWKRLKDSIYETSSACAWANLDADEE